MINTSPREVERTAQVAARPMMVGIEQEFDLSDGERDLDFRGLYPHIVAKARAFPFRNSDGAALVEAGYMLGCDGKEAEFATAPIHLENDGPVAAAREAIRCRIHMLQLLRGVGVPVIRGYSTHLSVSVPAGREPEIAQALSFTIGPALVMLLEARSSPGLLLRPRRGRIEVGSEYVDDERQLAAAITLLAGAVHAYLSNEERWNQLPRLKRAKWEEANIRPGIYLPRDAYGESIHDLGTHAQLELEDGGCVEAGDLLRVCGDLAIAELAGVVDEHSLRALAGVIRQPESLQIERGSDPGIIAPKRPGRPAEEAAAVTRLTRPIGRGLSLRFVDWEGAAFQWRGGGRDLVLGVPWAHLPAVFNAPPNRIVASVGASGPQGQLNSLDQLQTPQTFKSLDPAALGTQAVSDKGGAGGKGGGKGGGKLVGQIGYTEERAILPLPPSPVRPRGVPLLLIGVLVGLVLLVVVGGGALMLLRGGGGGQIALVGGTTPTTVLSGSVALARATDTPTPVGACLPAPALTSPANGAIRNNGVELLWNPTEALGQGQTFAVMASTQSTDLQGANATNFIVGTSEAPNMALDFSRWKFAGQQGNFYWTVRIQDAAGNFVDCGGGTPRHFSVALAQGPTKPPKESTGGSNGGKP